MSAAGPLSSEALIRLDAQIRDDLRAEVARLAAESEHRREVAASWRAHATEDCAALQRVWKLTQVWEAAAAGSSQSEIMQRALASQVRRAMAGES